MQSQDERATPPEPYTPWPSTPINTSTQPPIYPPPPEFYTSGAGRFVERSEERAFPAPPPEHDMSARYPVYPPAATDQWSAQASPSHSIRDGSVIVQPQPETPLRALGRFLIFIGSAALSVLAFWLWTNSWLLGAGIVALLFVHEMGHFIVIRAKGLPASLPVFIPLLGAYVTMRQPPRNVRDEAEIALAGPIAGGLAGLGCLALYVATGERGLITLAYFTFFINLLNLVPISPLDGGRVVGAISRWLWPVGLAIVGIAFFYTQFWILLLIAIFGLAQTVARFTSARNHNAYYKISFAERLYVTTLYFGLAAALVLGMVATQSGFFF